MLQILFLKILNMSLTSALIILLILIVRILFQKVPKKYIYLFWSVALFRLLYPFSLESIWSMIPSAEILPTELLTSTNRYDWSIHTGIMEIDQTVNPVLYDTSPSALVSNFTVLSWIWLAGMVGMLCYSLIALIRLRHTLIGAVRLRDQIYLSDYVGSPFVDGEVQAIVCYNTFELYDEEIPPEEFYKTVYAPLRLGSLYRWDDYAPINSSQNTETALATVYYKEEVQGQSAAQWPDRTVPGILFYDKERLVYLALQFTDVSLSTQQIRTIAQSIRISDTK